MIDWDYAETVAWIVKRDDEEVAAITQYLSGQRPQYDRALIAVILSGNPTKTIDINSIDQMIFQAARLGRITVEGPENGRGEYRPIPADRFRDCAFF